MLNSQVALDLRLRALDRNGIGELDEADPHFVPLMVEPPLEVLAREGPAVGEVVASGWSDLVLAVWEEAGRRASPRAGATEDEGNRSAPSGAV